VFSKVYCKVYCSRLCFIVQCALPETILKYSTWSHTWVSSEALPVERCQSHLDVAWLSLFQTVFNVVLVASCRLCYVQCRTQFFHVDIFLFPVSMSHVYFRFLVHLQSNILSEGSFLSEGASASASVEKGLALVPQYTGMECGSARKLGVTNKM
jgi:hypothetical protein